MNILVVSEYGQSAGLAHRLQKEGNNVRMVLTKGGRTFFDSDTVAYDFCVCSRQVWTRVTQYFCWVIRGERRDIELPVFCSTRVVCDCH